jgi:alkanesulfonate monooxygenase SsuD/methylene tetrahydromethanopterin reductase-like flavin-dependent oxidoreductase (luciferase family)
VPPRLLLVLSENWTMTSPRDLRALVAIAAEAEQAGIDGVMISEHVVLGPAAGARGVMANPREYAVPGNQPPDMPWPASVVLLSAIAAATERLRLVAGAIIAPLRSAAARQGTRHAGPAFGGQAGRDPDSELAPG